MSRLPMSRPARHATAPGPGQMLPGPGRATGPRAGLARLLAGAALAGLMLVLGLIAKTGPVTRLDLRVDRHIATHDRIGVLTSLARGLSTIATPETVGVGLMIGVPAVLLLARRRLAALKVFCMFAGAFALAETGKILIGEHRPPASLWAMPADSGASYPSGHATAAAILAVALIVTATTLTGRATALILGGLYAAAVAASRVYLADHYLLDVAGSLLCALAAACIVTGLAALPALQPWLHRLGGRRLPGPRSTRIPRRHAQR